MLQLLQLEWMKFRHFRVFQVMIICFMVLLPGLLMIGKSINSLPPGFGSTDMFYIFPTVFNFLAYIGNWLAFFFLGFLGVLLVTIEFGNRTLRQNIITGLSRQDVFFAKLIFISAICLAATLFYILCGMIIGVLHTETIYFSKVIQEAALWGRFFLMCLGYMTFGYLIGVLVKRTGLALFIYLTAVMFLEPLLRYGIHQRLFPGKSMHFYPMNALEDLTPLPFGKMAEQFMQENDFEFFLTPGQASITSVIYLFLFLGIIYWRLQKMDF